MRFSLKKISWMAVGASVMVGSAVLFQNCSSGVAFRTDLGSQGNVPLCRDLSAPEVQPKMKWDWFSQLDISDEANYPTFSQVMATPMVADLNKDGFPEVVFVSWSTSGPFFADTLSSSAYGKNGVLRIVDGRTGKTLKSVGEQDLAPYATTSPLLVDLDGDGTIEILYSHYAGRKLVALNADGSFRWSYATAKAIQNINSFSAADFNKDKRADVILGDEVVSEDTNGQPYRLFALAAPSASVYQFAYSLNESNPAALSIVGKNGVLDASGKLLFSLPTDLQYAAADIFKNVPGIEIVGTGNGFLKLFNGLTGEVLREIDLTPYNDLLCSSGKIGGGAPTVGDFDGDEDTTEVAVATGRYLIVMNEDLQLMAKFETQDCSSLSTGISSFDFNGDKKPEILYADEEYLRIFEFKLDPTGTNSLNVVAKFVNPSGTLHEYPVVADIDGNGSSELLVVSNNYPVEGFYKDPSEEGDREIARGVTGVRAFESYRVDSWMPTRPIWHQYDFNPAMVSNNGQVAPFIPVGVGFTDRIFRRNAQLGLFEATCK